MVMVKNFEVICNKLKYTKSVLKQ